ncbi:MAG: hypothetical protein CVV03_05165 [Firmicutes bacterium HGW-Firmicutes-8]|nr:MAG: hypothetical protein CVV03_05165 [Firmicutes bacterium HGW-Firmicutes-8]
MATQIKVRAENLVCAKNVIDSLDEQLLRDIKRTDLEIVQKVAGVGFELGIALWAQGIKKLEDITDATLVDFLLLPGFFNERYWSKIVLAEQGSGFLSSVLDGLSGCLENPQSLAGIAETLGINTWCRDTIRLWFAHRTPILSWGGVLKGRPGLL